jgi:hypothetical protein
MRVDSFMGAGEDLDGDKFPLPPPPISEKRKLGEEPENRRLAMTETL